MFLGIRGLGCFQFFRVFGACWGLGVLVGLGLQVVILEVEGCRVSCLGLFFWGGGELGLSLELRARSLGLETRRSCAREPGVSRTCAQAT